MTVSIFTALRSQIREGLSVLKINRRAVLLFGAFLAVGGLSFAAGQVDALRAREIPLTVTIRPPLGEQAVLAAAPSTTVTPLNQAEVPADQRACAFVGSRNSNLYHLPTCAVAKRIKPENRVCFATTDDAKQRGYRAGCVQ